MLPAASQAAGMMLAQQHGSQRERLQTHHRLAYRALCAAWENQLKVIPPRLPRTVCCLGKPAQGNTASPTAHCVLPGKTSSR